MARKTQGDEELKAKIMPLVEELAAFMGLSQQWHLTMSVGDLKDENGKADLSTAEIDWPANYQTANIKFNRPWLRKADHDRMQKSVAHELLHLVFAPIDNALEAMIGTEGEVYGRYKAALEGVVDRVACLILRARDQEETTDASHHSK